MDWHVFANVWREEGYIKVMYDVAQGLRPWEPVYVVGTMSWWVTGRYWVPL